MVAAKAVASDTTREAAPLISWVKIAQPGEAALATAWMTKCWHARRCCSSSGQWVVSRVEEEVVMPRVRALINDWRSRSRELRYAAVKTADVKAKASMMGAADGYDKLAQQTASENERRPGKGPSQGAMQG